MLQTRISHVRMIVLNAMPQNGYLKNGWFEIDNQQPKILLNVYISDLENINHLDIGYCSSPN